MLTVLIKAQTKTHSQQFVELRTHFGEPIIYSDSLGSTLTKTFIAANIRWGIQSQATSSQNILLAYPAYGIGLYHVNLSNPDTLGRPWALYGFYSAPIFRWGKLSLGYDLALGIAWNFSKFNFITNNKMDLIGSNLNAYFNGGLFLKYEISNRLDLSLAVDFTHFSNGAVNMPNKGMNLRGVNGSLSYHFMTHSNQAYKRADFESLSIPKFKKYNEIDITTSLGGKATTTRYQTGPIYLATTTEVDFYHHYQCIGKYGAGLDMFYDNSLSESYLSTLPTPTNKFMFVGIHLSHELRFSKLGVVTQAGTYLYRGSAAKGWFFFRLSLQYYLSSNLYAGVSLKTANGFKADYITLGLGYRFVLRKQ